MQNNFEISSSPVTVHNGCLNKPVQICQANIPFCFVFGCEMLQGREGFFKAHCGTQEVSGCRAAVHFLNMTIHPADKLGAI